MSVHTVDAVAIKLQALMAVNPLYSLTQYNGQRRFAYALLQDNNKQTAPPRGCEVFVGKLPFDIFEDELVPFFAQIAPVYELRLMVATNGRNRGYCFVRYFKREHADRAIAELNKQEIRSGRFPFIRKSLDNTRLFVGGLPQDKTLKEIWDALDEHIEDIDDIIMYPPYNACKENRGYVFLQFKDHRAAAIARRRLPPGSLMLWGTPIRVDWAEPLPDPDPDVMAEVTTLYVRNLPVEMSPGRFKHRLFELINPNWCTKAHKQMNYAFVHMINRTVAEQAKEMLSNCAFDGTFLDVSWARPECFNKHEQRNAILEYSCLSLPAKLRNMVKDKWNSPPATSASSYFTISEVSSDSQSPIVDDNSCHSSDFSFDRAMRNLQISLENFHLSSSTSHEFNIF